MIPTVTVHIPGLAFRRLAEGDFPRDEPAIWIKIDEAPVRRIGKRGYRVDVTLTHDELNIVGDYLDSVLGAMHGFVDKDSNDYALMKALRTTLAAISSATGVHFRSLG